MIMRMHRMAAATLVTAALGVVRATHADPLLTTLASFDGANGAYPQVDAPVVDSAGNVYGTAGYEGPGDNGTVFEVAAHSGIASVVAAFNVNSGTGYNPAGVLLDTGGNLYGTTTGGNGTVFEIKTGSGMATTVATFAPPSALPGGTLTQDSAGNIYGTTGQDGENYNGTVFKFSTGDQSLTTIGTFPPPIGDNYNSPLDGLLRDAAGNLYGTTGRVVFMIPAIGGTTVVLAGSYSGGGGFNGGLTLDSAGNLYGTTLYGGQYSAGSVFEIVKGSGTVTTLASFAPSPPGTNLFSDPVGGLIRDAAGNLFGTTLQGGAVQGGSVFELPAGSSTLATLVSFPLVTTSPTDANPNYPEEPSRLAVDSAGNFYGVTPYGGTSGQGTVFEVTGTGYGSAVYTVSSGQSIHFSAGDVPGIFPRTIPGLAVQNSGSAVVDPATAAGNRQLLTVGTFTLAGSNGDWTGTLDLSDNDLDLPGGSLAITTDQVRQGYNLAGGGNWNGPGGITSATAAADSTHLTALGVIQNDQSGSPLYTAANPFDGTTPGASDILIKYTYYGDANLDGKVDGSDYSLIDAGYAGGGSLTGWYYGDFNYDGVVDGSDYALIDNAFNNQGGSLTSTALAAGYTAEVAVVPEPVPEPASVAVLGLGLIAGLAARGSRHDRRRA